MLTKPKTKPEVRLTAYNGEKMLACWYFHCIENADQCLWDVSHGRHQPKITHFTLEIPGKEMQRISGLQR
jgi:hypothetical protein